MIKCSFWQWTETKEKNWKSFKNIHWTKEFLRRNFANINFFRSRRVYDMISISVSQNSDDLYANDDMGVLCKWSHLLLKGDLDNFLIFTCVFFDRSRFFSVCLLRDILFESNDDQQVQMFFFFWNWDYKLQFIQCTITLLKLLPFANWKLFRFFSSYYEFHRRFFWNRTLSIKQKVIFFLDQFWF